MKFFCLAIVGSSAQDFLSSLSGRKLTSVRSVCNLPKTETGFGRAHIPSWTYDSATEECVSFIYGGRGANANIFRTEDACHDACQLDVCPAVFASYQAYEQGLAGGPEPNIVKEYAFKETVPFWVSWMVNIVGGSPGFPTRDDTDKALLIENNGDCTMVFRGADSDMDFLHSGLPALNNIPFFPTFTERWGVQGLHAGVIEELEPLVNLMDFKEIRNKCPGKFSVAGHSMGGAMAEVFAVLLTRTNDPINAQAAGIKLDKLHTFGSFGALSTMVENPQSADGCFGGTQIWYAQPSKDNDDVYAIDILEVQALGAKYFEPLKSTRMLVLEDGSQIAFPCGQSVPDFVSLQDEIGELPAGKAHSRYQYHLGCAK